MANQLAMDKSFAINNLRASGYSERRIAETLGVSRGAVRRHLKADNSNNTKAPTGSGDLVPTGSGDQLLGATDRAVSFPSNDWEYVVSQKDSSFTYYIPVRPEMVGKKIEVVVLALDAEHVDLAPSAWITCYPIPLEGSELVLE